MGKENKPSEKDLTALIQSAKNQDQNAFEQLLTLYTPLIDSMVKKFSSSPITDEDEYDLRQEAVLGFYRALLGFDTEQTAVTFGLYAKECIHNGLVSHLRSENKQRKVILTEDAPSVPAKETDLSSRLVEKEDFLALAKKISGLLTAYEESVWWLYLSGRTAKEIATAVGKEEKSVTNAIYRIRKKLRSGILDP